MTNRFGIVLPMPADLAAWWVRHGCAGDYARYSGGTYADQQRKADEPD